MSCRTKLARPVRLLARPASGPAVASQWLGSSARPPRLIANLTTTKARRQHSGHDIARVSFARSRERPQAARPPRPSPLLLFALACAGFVLYRRYRRSRHPRLNPTTFTPYAIIGKQAVSPTSFVLTLRPPASAAADESAALAIHADAWSNLGLWSVEAKQPQIQVARDYTPLPPRYGFDGDLRVFVRAVRGGEVSSYLASLEMGDTVELRGPHWTFDLKGSAGQPDGRVVFLAGGTGIAPAMQVVRTLLEGGGDVSGASSGSGSRPRVTILWANRSWEEVSSGPRPARPSRPWYQAWSLSNIPRLVSLNDVKSPTPIAEQLQEMKRRHGDALDVRLAIDEDGVFISEKDVAAAMGLPAVAAPSAAPAADNLASNLIVVSGPDGFVSRYAGPKRWDAGAELQGTMGGVLGELRRNLGPSAVPLPDVSHHLAHASGAVTGMRTTRFGVGGESWMLLKL